MSQPREAEPDVPERKVERAKPRTRPYDPTAKREDTRVILTWAFSVGMGFILLGFALGRISEPALLALVSSFFTLFGAIIGFYFGKESNK